MSFKLTKEERARRDDIAARLQRAAEDLREAVDEYNTEVEKLREPIEMLLSKYNEVLSEGREFAQDIASQADSDFADRSEKWQESERGQAAGQFKDEWDILNLDDIEIDFPDELSFEEPDHADLLEQAPEEMSS